MELVIRGVVLYVVIFIVLWRQRGRGLPAGHIFGQYLVYTGAARFAVDAHHDLIPMHHAAHLAAIQVKILQVSVFRDQKTVTIGMGVNSALNQMLTVRKGVVVFL